MVLANLAPSSPDQAGTAYAAAARPPVPPPRSAQPSRFFGSLLGAGAPALGVANSQAFEDKQVSESQRSIWRGRKSPLSLPLRITS
jgi:hypothetical protein